MDAKRYETEGSVKASYKKSSLMDKTVAILATAFFIFSGIPVPTSFADTVPITLNDARQQVPVVTLEQANAQSAPARDQVPTGSAIQNPNPLSINVSSDLPTDGNATPAAAAPQGAAERSSETQPEEREILYILPETRAESRADMDLFMALLASKGITSITRVQIAALKPADTDTMHITHGVYFISQKENQIAVAFSAEREFGQMVDEVVYGKYVIRVWHTISITPFSNILYQPAQNSQNRDVVIPSLKIVRMGFTNDGYLAVEGEYGGARAYNTNGEAAIWADRVVELPSVPNGWTRAASNPNYAFQVRNVGSRQVLVVRDLVTGKETRAAVALKPFTIGATFDIASDGKTLVYIHTGPRDYAGRTVVQSMSNRSKKVSLSGLATSVQFAQGLWVLTLNGRTVKVDPVKMKIVS